jgi:hypothetical protein
MLVKLTVRQWDGFKKDRRVSAEIDTVFQTEGNAGNYNKRLLDKSVLSPIQRAIYRLRADHKFYTIPWCYDGVDLLPSKLYFDYTESIRKHKDLVGAAVDNLVQQYPVHRANQAKKLGNMFDPQDYPAQDELRTRFDVSTLFFPVPQEGHFVVDLEAKEAGKIKQDLTRILAEAQGTALTQLYTRVMSMLEHLHERLADPGNVFRDSLIENLASLAEVLPGLNIFEDERLAKAARAINDVAYVNPAQLREDPELRARIAQRTQDIYNSLKGD